MNKQTGTCTSDHNDRDLASEYHVNCVNEESHLASNEEAVPDPRYEDTLPLLTNATDHQRYSSCEVVPRMTSMASDANYGSIQNETTRNYSQSISSEYERGSSETDSLRLLQAQVFLEDAAKYRSIDHKVDDRSLQLYRFYHSMPFSLLKYFVIFLIHFLAFIETPSSLTWTSDIRYRADRVTLPCGVTESIELACLAFLTACVFIKFRVYGYQHFINNRWLLLEMAVLFVSLVDWNVSVSLGCSEVVRIRRMMRPVFIIQNSSLMKKILKSLRKTMTQILGVLLLMALHLYVFTLFGMLLFPEIKETVEPSDNAWIADNHSNNGSDPSGDESQYFRTLTASFMSLLVLLTTANNPDVTLPAYRKNRLFALFFIVFLIIGLYCFMNMLTAIIYNQFRGYFLSSMQSSLMRRRLGQRAAFESLRNKTVILNVSRGVDGHGDQPSERAHVAVRDLKVVISQAKLPKHLKVLLIQATAVGYSQWQMLTWNQFRSILNNMEKDIDKAEKPSIRWFRNHRRLVSVQKLVCHKYFSHFGCFMAFLNVVMISFELATKYDEAMSDSTSALRIINFLFILYYMVEQILILVCMGWRRYLYGTASKFDAIIVLILCISEIVTIGLYGLPIESDQVIHSSIKLWNIVRLINILIMIRLLRIIWHIKAMAIVAHTLVDLVKNLQSFGGILIVIYYSFAILGMELFQGSIKYSPSNVTNSSVCGSYQQLQYWANNFDDFAAAIVVLWDVMVVNNWFIFLDAYAASTTKWSYLYFIAWWLTSVVLVLNLFTALILENFIMKWDRFHHSVRASELEASVATGVYHTMSPLTVHDMFRPDLQEPSEEDIVSQMNALRFFHTQSECVT